MKRPCHIPRYTLTVIVTAVILYLTLFPRPLPANAMRWFAGADKAVHALMFLAWAFAAIVDTCRGRKQELHTRLALVCFVATMAFGGGIEIAQTLMQMGRIGDWWDLAADAIGAIVGTIIGRIVLLRKQ